MTALRDVVSKVLAFPKPEAREPSALPPAGTPAHHSALALVIHGIGEPAKGSTLKAVVKDFLPFIRERLDGRAIIAAEPLDREGAAEVSFRFRHAKSGETYHLRFVEVWWTQAFNPPALGPLIVGGFRAFARWFTRQRDPPSNRLTLVGRMIAEAVSRLAFNLMATLIAAALLILVLPLAVIGLVGHLLGLPRTFLADLHEGLLNRVAKHQPFIVQTVVILLSPALVLLVLLLWLLEAILPFVAGQPGIKGVHRFLVNHMTRHWADMWTYLHQSWEASQIRSRFEEDFEKAIKSLDLADPSLDSVMVIAHSMGSVVAYEALTGPRLAPLIAARFKPGVSPRLYFVTVGSSLNLSWDSAPREEEFRLVGSLPGCAEWLNLWSDYDYVGGYPLSPPKTAWQGRRAISLETPPPSLQVSGAPSATADAQFSLPLQQREVVNQMDLFSDHSAYWNNAEEVVAPILDRLTGRRLHGDFVMKVPARRHRVRVLASFKATAWLAGPMLLAYSLWDKSLTPREGNWLFVAADWALDKLNSLLPKDIKVAAQWLWPRVVDGANWLLDRANDFLDAVNWLLDKVARAIEWAADQVATITPAWLEDAGDSVVDWLLDKGDAVLDRLVKVATPDDPSWERSLLTGVVAAAVGLALYSSVVKWLWDAWDRAKKYDRVLSGSARSASPPE